MIAAGIGCDIVAITESTKANSEELHLNADLYSKQTSSAQTLTSVSNEFD